MYSVISRVIAALLFFFAVSFSFVNAMADEAEEETKQAEQTAVIVVTDPDIAGAEDEEPDCE